MDFLFLVWLKLAILSVFWILGSVVYFMYNYYPLKHPYTTIAFGPMVVIFFLPIVVYAVHFIFFYWE